MKNNEHTQFDKDLPIKLSDKEILLRNLYKDCDDIVFHPVSVHNMTYLLTYFSGLCDEGQLNQHVISQILQGRVIPFECIPDQLTSVSHTSVVSSLKDVIEELSSGNAILLMDSETKAITFNLTKFDKRAIDEPQAESVVMGPREGFVESIATNQSLVRRKLKTPSLKMRSLKAGSLSKTSLSIAYLDGIAQPEVVEEVQTRLKKIDVDAILSNGAIEEKIEDTWFSPFPQVQSTERPDVVASALLEGRVAIFIDGTPFVLIVPVTLFALLQTPEDYNERFFNGTFVRWIRYSFILVALLAPSTYVAVLTFHQEMIPTTLLLRIAQSREEIPFPAFVEALLMEVVFEVLREAGIRLPKQMGSTVSVVGTLVVGQAAIQAGLVSAPMVMIVAITGISSFLLPQYSVSVSIRWLRFPIMFLAAVLGLLGMMLGMIILVSHLCILRSFGVPYMAPLAPFQISFFRDVFIRAPLRFMKKKTDIYTRKEG